VLVLLVALVLACLGSGEPGLRAGIRVTARTSYALFLLPFAASSCVTLFPGPAASGSSDGCLDQEWSNP